MKLEWKGPLEHNNNWPPKFYMPQGKSFMEPFFTLFTALFCIRSCLTPLTLLKIDKLTYFLCTPASSWCRLYPTWWGRFSAVKYSVQNDNLKLFYTYTLLSIEYHHMKQKRMIILTQNWFLQVFQVTDMCKK